MFFFFNHHAEASSNSNVQHGNMCKFTTKHTNIMEAVAYLTVRSGSSAKVVRIKIQVRHLIGESDLINTLTARITHNVAISACQAGLKFRHLIRSMMGKYDILTHVYEMYSCCPEVVWFFEYASALLNIWFVSTSMFLIWQRSCSRCKWDPIDLCWRP